MNSVCDSDYDNCGPDAEGDHCLFHKSDKSEEETRRFYDEMKGMGLIDNSKGDVLVFNDGIDWRGYVFPPLPDEEMGSLFFDGAVFKKRVLLKDAVFEGDCHLIDSTFHENSDFTIAVFQGDALFTDADFKGVCKFVASTFEGQAIFTKADFEDVSMFVAATFQNETKFGDTAFKGKSYFKDTVFKDGANFVDAVFEDEVHFKNTMFEGVSHFWDVTFKRSCDFTDSAFSGMSEFVGTEFLDRTDFNGADFKKKCNFEAMFEGDASFNEVDFEGPADFGDSEFAGELNFRNSYFKRGIVLEEDRSHYEKIQAWKEASRILKLDYMSVGENEKADEMFVQERRAIRKQRAEDSSIMKSISALADRVIADWTCEYGTNWERLLGVSAILLLTFSLAYFLLGPIIGMGEISGINGDGLSAVGDCIYYSIATFTTLGHGNMYPVGFCMKLLSALESMIGAVMMVLIVVVFARKWLR